MSSCRSTSMVVTERLWTFRDTSASLVTGDLHNPNGALSHERCGPACSAQSKRELSRSRRPDVGESVDLAERRSALAVRYARSARIDHRSTSASRGPAL